MVAGARAAAGTPCAERSPVNLRSGGVERERGLAWRGAARRGARGVGHRDVLWRCQGASNTWPFLSARVLALAEQPNV
jgi:hypothetical protein